MTTIGDYAIFMCESLNTIDLPDTALDIGKCGIYGCTALASLRFSRDARSLGSFVFGNSGANGEDIQVFGPVNATVLPAAMDSVTDYGTVLGNYNLYDCAFVLDGKLVGVSRIRAGMKLAVPDIVERQAKKIIGWSIGADGELVNIGADVMPDDTLILYGVWGYDFDYENADGGVRLTGYHGFDTDIVVPEDINGVPVVEIAVDTFGSRAGITLIANKGSIVETFAGAHGYPFTALTYRLRFMTDGGTAIADRQLAATESIALPEVRKTNYTFKGWYTDRACTELWEEGSMPADNLTLYAAWTRRNVGIADNPYTFIATEGGIAITGYTGTASALTIPSAINGQTVVAIADHAFAYNDTVFRVTLPDSIATIGSCSFIGSRLDTITIDGSVVIGDHAFADCAELNNVTFRGSVIALSPAAFSGCTALRSITLPDGLTSLPERCFEGCSYLASVALPESLEMIGDSAFARCIRLDRLTFGSHVTQISSKAFAGCTSLQAFAVEDTNTFLKTVDGVLFDHSGAKLIAYPAGKTGTVYTIPARVTSICDYAFSHSNLKTVDMSSNDLQSIGAYAFQYSGELTGFTLPDSANFRTIGEGAFLGCTALRNVTMTHITRIEKDAFAACGALEEVRILGDPVIGENAFVRTDKLVIVANAGTRNEEYAIEHGIRFVDMTNGVPVTGIVLDEDVVYMQLYTNRVFTARLLPDDTTETDVTWTTSDASVVMIG